MTSVASLVAQLKDLGIEPGDTILVHTSFRAIRPIEGGPDAVIDALIEAVGPEGTVVMPSWTSDDDEIFDPTTYEVDEDLGVVADEFWQRPGVIRGTHPFAVAAWGTNAEEIAGAPFVLPPHARDSGVDRVRNVDGKVILLGVDHDANTTIHLAELDAGVPYRKHLHITVADDDGQPERIDYDENDHCCRGFNMAGPWLRERGLLREGPFGSGTAMVARSKDVVATVVEELSGDLCRFLCAPGTCEECDEARAGIPG